MKRLRLYNVIFAVVIASAAYAFSLTGGNFSALFPFQGVVILLPIVMLLTRGLDQLGTNNALIWMLFSYLLLLNLLIHVGMGSYSNTMVTAEFATFHVLGIVGTLFSVQWAAVHLSPERIMRYAALSLLPLIVLAIAVAISEGGLGFRAAPFGIHPNWWGELGFAFTIAALTLHGKVRLLLIGVVMVLFVLVQSRGALLAAGVCVGSYMFFTIRTKRARWLQLAIMAVVPVLAAVVMLLMQQQSVQAWLIVRDYLLLLNDPYRGIDSSLTGRVEGWAEAINIIGDNPFLGVGLDTLSVHNGYLQVAAGGGLPLLIALVLMIVAAAWSAHKKNEFLRLSVILSYAVYAITYPRMLNMNLASVFFYFSLFSWSGQRDRVRIGESNHLTERKRAINTRPLRQGGAPIP